MNDEIPKPKRKRWRWIIAGVLLFAVAVTGWWYWPRGDARFVGKWRTDSPDDPFILWTFHPNGILEKRYETIGFVEKTTWWVEGDFVAMGRHWQPTTVDSIIPLSDLWGKLTDLFAGDEWEQMRIQHISNSDLELNFRNGHDLFKLKRAPE